MRNADIFQSTIGTAPQMFVNNVSGKYWYRKQGPAAVCVMRNMMHISSNIVEADVDVNIELPGHPAFVLMDIDSVAGTIGTGVVPADAPLRKRISTGHQIIGMCPLGGR